ncbi:MAG TPA: hypothetical protein PLZ93_03245 [Nocardioides sp.]|uniref:hypothetical protein n=1 Tax=uncultured Nocardioides sp. TaxID=198441 RepID=UPI000ECFC4E7|nr:hypothetical protein [uncultured Nocardioides sp.]HCB05533.1 hypothetical protein [Nocardioides sp.]HRD60907.1 hypothetical protein [Nocardioides sp.]HRI94606.1 hypothetical protein [Nocardioides sp.]HRK45059.1 hypothetical protein [Nocardioides sp.]
MSTHLLPATTRAPGLLLKRIVLVFGATYLAMVCVTNLVDFVTSVTGAHETFLNSQNSGYIASIVKIYSMPSWFDDLAVLGAATIEGIGALLFVRALRRFRGGGTGLTEVYQALAWNIVVWFGFIVGTEFFIAYPSESPFRELLGLGFLMTLIVTLVPDAPGVIRAE